MHFPSTIAGSLLLLVGTAMAASPPASRIYTCEFKLGRGCISGQAEAEWRGGRLWRSAVWTHFCSPGKLGYSCTWDVSRESKQSRWEDSARDIKVYLRDEMFPESENMVLISRRNRSLKISNIKTSGEYCGAAAQLPDWIIIPESGKTCIVAFDMSAGERRNYYKAKPKPVGD